MTKFSFWWCVLTCFLCTASISAHDIKFSRLSADINNPLFNAVIVGKPVAEHIAFFTRVGSSCRLIIIETASGKIVSEFSDFAACEQSDSIEDSYSLLSASVFDNFSNQNAPAIKSLLKKFQIDHGTIGKFSSDGMCIEIGASVICADEELKVRRKLSCE